jgi:hypothetical protein
VDLELETEVVQPRQGLRLGLPVEITAHRIGQISTKFGAPSQAIIRPRNRWGVNTVWKTQSGMYVLVRSAYSLIYHRKDTFCRTINRLPNGDEATVAKMAEALGELGHTLADAVSCDHCKPAWPEDLQAAQLIRYEFPRVSLDRCPDGPWQVISRLTRSRKSQGTVGTEVSQPIADLLDMCEANDPEWSTAQAPMEKIG